MASRSPSSENRERAGEQRETQGSRRDRRARADEVGADDAADGGRPHDDAEVTRAVLRVREVGTGIPRLAVGCRGAAEQHARDEEQRKLRITPADEADRTGRGQHVAEDQAGAAAVGRP